MVVMKEDKMKHVMRSEAGVLIGPCGILKDDVLRAYKREEKKVGRFSYKGLEYGVLPRTEGSMVCVVPAESGELLRDDAESMAGTRIVAWSGLSEMGIVLIPGSRGSRVEFTSGINLRN